MSDPKEIYLQPQCCAGEDEGRLWCQDPDPVECDEGVPWTRYIRADLVEYKDGALNLIELVESSQ